MIFRAISSDEASRFGISNHEGVTPLADRDARPYVVLNNKTPPVENFHVLSRSV